MQIGQINKLKISHFTPQGAYLTDETQKEVLLPKKFLISDFKEGEELEVFLYTDSSDRPVATTQKPLALCGQVAILEVKDFSEFGCFLDLGLDKDILMPSKNLSRFRVGDRVCVFLTLDKQQRIIAKLGVKEHLKPFYPKQNQNPYAILSALPFEKTPLGISCVVCGCYYGLLYHNELFTSIPLFEKISVQIKTIRKDGKLDLKLNTTAHHQMLFQKLLEKKMLDFNYDSNPESIQKTFGMSKKTFKRSLTYLIENKKARLIDNKIYLF